MGNLLPFVKQATVETLSQWELSGRAADMVVNANDIILVRILPFISAIPSLITLR